ncbi:MAG: twin-arginine translocase TatA/TatE family subunit [Deltaproteobacteria bacterium]|nr:twin-arginine translocase TatA/TatE family subunit [Deltaproteobacteria bacterium]
MFSLGIQEILVIVIVVLLLIDYKKIPEFMKGIGRVYREIKSAQENITNEIMRGNITEDGENTDINRRDINPDNNSYDKQKEGENGPGRAG